MNIFLREMKAYSRSLIIWCACAFLMVAAGMGKYTAYSSAGAGPIKDLVKQLPKSVQSIFGLAFFDVTTLKGYYGVLFLFLVLMATIHAAMLGAGIISKEERDKTSEFLFVRPVSRNMVITGKLSAAFVNILVFNLVTLLSSIAILGKYSKGEAVADFIVILMVGMLALQLIFMLIGSGTAASSRNPKTAVSVTTGILLTTFILYEVIDFNSKLEFLKYITPFKYFDAKNLLSDVGFEPVYIILSAVIAAVMLGMTFLLYKKRI